MIGKFLQIKNIGKFLNSSSPSESFNTINLIYSPNGYGKTTLTSIYR